jgi:hypothetical protein
MNMRKKRERGTETYVKPERYVHARLILNDLREKYTQGMITWQQYSTLRGQALAGDVDGAVKGLGRVLLRNAEGEV